MNSTKILIVILILNFFTAILYLLRFVHKDSGNRKRYLLESFFMVICPVVGPLYLFVCFLSEQLYFRFKRVDDLAFFAKNKKKIHIGADWETESNIVPLEEVLLISEKENKRKELLHILKTDYSKSLYSVSKALEDPDSETSHYAASILMQEKSEIQMYVQKVQTACRDNKDDMEVHFIYLNYLNDILNMNIFSEMEEKNYLYQMDSLLEDINMRWEEEIEPSMFLNIGRLFLKWLELENVEKWIHLLEKRYPDTLECYELKLRFYYATGQRHYFFSVLESLKKSEIALNNEILELIRFFGKN